MNTNKKHTNKKKLGYKQYESLLSNAHNKIDMVAQKVQELQTYFIGYVEFKGENIKFNNWMNKRLEEMRDELQKNVKSNEPHMEGSTTDQG